MDRIGYHASHEQFSPSRLLRLVKLAESAGFHEAKSSDHFHPWSERQGQSGFAWAWLGAAMEATRLPIGIISAPGYRYHPAVLAQAAATIGEMYPGRMWLALGSGEAINEAITGEYMRRLLAGERVTHRGRVQVVEAKLYSRPVSPVPLFGAAVSAATAQLAGRWADGILLAGHRPQAVRPPIDAFREAGGDGKPIHVQMAVSWDASLQAAGEAAVHHWAAASIGGEVAWDLRRPADFDLASRFAGVADLSEAVLVTDSLAELEDRVSSIAEIGATVVHLHMVGPGQEAFIERVGESGLLKRLAADGERVVAAGSGS
jgi:coenzyme F420-dependent glucose-6-phosphate dehydrogenase